MDVSRLLLSIHTSVSFLLIYTSTFLHGDFIPAGSTIESIAKRSTIEVSQFCGDEIQCRSRLDRRKCLELNVCQEDKTCIGRDGFPPAVDPLLEWSNKTTMSPQCLVSDKRPMEIPSALSTTENTALFTLNNTDSSLSTCYIRTDGNLGDVFSLTFWMKTDCIDCTVIDLDKTGHEFVSIRVNGGDEICLDQECVTSTNLRNGKWEHVALTYYQGDITLYINGMKAKHVKHTIHDIFIGSLNVSHDHTLYVIHAEFFQDVLTPREIKEKVTGLIDPIIDKCRCPPNYPNIFDTDNSLCVNDNGETSPRVNISVRFKHPDVILEDSSENWASAEQGPVTLSLKLSTSYEIESIDISFKEPPPSDVTYRLISNGQEQESRGFTCSSGGNICVASLGSLDNSATMEQYEQKVADGLKIVLNRDHNDDVRSFILSKITIHGRCDCNGNAASCTTKDDSYSCACDPNTNSEGPHCRSCKGNFYKNPEDFDCKHSCQCFVEGVVDTNDQCDENGGRCICKQFVEGDRCDQCMPWTHSLDGMNINGCTACNCLQSGAETCNNKTGMCTCKPNVAAPNCHKCFENHYGFDLPQGCKPCNCMAAGTIGQNLGCDENDGQCVCKKNVEGQSCDQCKFGYFNMQTPNLFGCESCDCNAVGVDNGSCNQTTGQCACRGDVFTDRTCSPEITSVDPTYGPLIGATRITIRGKLLGNFTRSVSVYLGNIEQPITAVNDSAIVVETKQHNSSTTLDLRVGWVGMTDMLKAPSSFSYRPDPVLESSKTVKGSSFVSGGCLVQLHGSNLMSVKQPRLDVRHKDDRGKLASGPCYHRREMVVCATPDINHLYSSSNNRFEMAAVFDGVLLDLGDVDVKPDPTINSVGNIEFQHDFEDSISISGKNLLSSCETNKYTVLVGRIPCSISHISDTGIECEPPKRKPKGPEKIPITVSIGNIQHQVGTLQYLEWYESTYFFIAVGCLAGAIVLVIVGFIVYQCCRRKKKTQYRKNPAGSTMSLSKAADRVINTPMNAYSNLTGVTSDSTQSNGHNGVIRVESVFLEPKKGIVNSAAETNVLSDEFLPHVETELKADVMELFIGGGSFGIGDVCFLQGRKAKLVEGTLQRQRHSAQKLIAKSFIQTIQESLQPPSDENSPLVPWAQQALKECLRFKKYKHNHLLHVIGIGVDQQKIHILYEHMSRGTLKAVVSDIEQDYSIRKLLGFSQQVAEGIAFLASKDLTHKDVAARNCMLDEYSMVKLGDAAFSWDFYHQEYVYNRQRERYMPLRWMAPESLDHGYYDMRTDVWSFGVLVWELLTRGCLPFHEVDDSDVTEFILNGYVLGKPETVSNSLYRLLSSCWSPESENRPSIAAISSALCNILEKDDDDDTYANMTTPRMRASAQVQFYSSTNVSGV